MPASSPASNYSSTADLRKSDAAVKTASQAVSADRPVVVEAIFDPEVREEMSDNLGSFDRQHRYARTLMFRNYLSVTWESSGLRPQYLDWNETVRYGQSNFDVVHRAISKIVEARTSARFEHRRG